MLSMNVYYYDSKYRVYRWLCLAGFRFLFVFTQKGIQIYLLHIVFFSVIICSWIKFELNYILICTKLYKIILFLFAFFFSFVNNTTDTLCCCSCHLQEKKNNNWLLPVSSNEQCSNVAQPHSLVDSVMNVRQLFKAQVIHLQQSEM